MDLTSVIEIIIAVVVVYFFIKLIAVPIVRIILGVITFLILIYLLQRFLGFNFGQILAPFGISFNSSKWGLNLNWVSGSINFFINKLESFFSYLLGNLPKNK